MEKEDRVLIEETLSGKLESYDDLMQRYQNLVFKIALGFGRNKDNAMDITQNAFLKGYENLKSFKGKSPFKSWISRIAYNEGVNWSRKHGKFAADDSIEEENFMHDHQPSQEDEILAKEHKKHLMRSLFSLNTKYRLAVVLRYWKNTPIKEIAAIMNTSEGVVKNMLYRSLQRLRTELSAQNIRGVH